MKSAGTGNYVCGRDEGVWLTRSPWCLGSQHGHSIACSATPSASALIDRQLPALPPWWLLSPLPHSGPRWGYGTGQGHMHSSGHLEVLPRAGSVSRDLGDNWTGASFLLTSHPGPIRSQCGECKSHRWRLEPWACGEGDAWLHFPTTGQSVIREPGGQQEGNWWSAGAPIMWALWSLCSGCPCGRRSWTLINKWSHQYG